MSNPHPDNKRYSGLALALAAAGGLILGVAVGVQLPGLLAKPQAAQVAQKPGPAMPPAGMVPDAGQPTVNQAANNALAQIPGLKAKAESQPGNAAAWTQLGNAYFDADQPTDAVSAYRKALALAPGSPDVWTDLGIMYRELKQFKEALEAFDQARALDPKHRNSRFNKGVVLLHDLNDRAGALAAWKEVLAQDPTARTPGGESLAAIIQELEGK